MKSSLRSVVLLVVAGVVAVCLASTATANGSRVTTFRLVEKDSSFHFVDNPPQSKAGPSAGDVFVFTAELLTRSGKHAGNLHATCTVTTGGKHSVSTCLGTFGLAGGQLQAQALITDGAKADHISIVGGTGVYVGARGEVISVSRGENSPFSDDTISLLRSS